MGSGPYSTSGSPELQRGDHQPAPRRRPARVELGLGAVRRLAGRPEADGTAVSQSAVARFAPFCDTGVTAGSSGTARGGGVFDSPVPNGPPGGPLRLGGSHITHNTLRGGHGVTVSGGGVVSTYAVDLTDSVIDRNSPDQCFGR
jgi:hypothetical protein